MSVHRERTGPDEAAHSHSRENRPRHSCIKHPGMEEAVEFFNAMAEWRRRKQQGAVEAVEPE